MMKKILNFKQVALVLFAGLMAASCQDDDTNIGMNPKPNLTAAVTNITVNEGTDAVLHFTLDRAINKPIQYRLVMQDESTAVDQDDYIIPGCRSNDVDCGISLEENGGPVGYIFEIPAYTTEYTVNIQTILDEANEGSETLRLKVVSNRTLLGTVNDLFFDINIQNVASDDLSVRLKWDGTFTSGGEEVDFCDVDMDIEVYDADFNLVLSSYSDCPEGIVMAATMPDGEYSLVASLWSRSGFNEPINVPASIRFFKSGSTFSETLDLTDDFRLDEPALEEGGDAFRTFAITKAGTHFTIRDEDSNIVAEGRMANIKSKIARKVALKKAQKAAKIKK